MADDALAKAAYCAIPERSRPSWDALAESAKQHWRNAAHAVLEKAACWQLLDLVREFGEKSEETRRFCSQRLLGYSGCSKETCGLWETCAEVDRGERIKAALQRAGRGSE